jgi:AcrR family transcriptional regulator
LSKRTQPVPNELSPRAREIVAVARELLEAEGPAGLSMRKVADRVGIRAPSIYKHFPDKRTLEHAIVSTVFEDLADAFESALEDADPVGTMVTIYRRQAQEHPHLYRLMTEQPLQRDLLVPGVEERASLPARLLVGDDPDAGRALWALAHGLTILELNERFPPGADIDAAWRAGFEAFRRYAEDRR